jgi:hypothetical protein
MCFFSHFEAINHQWQMMPLGQTGTSNSKIVVGIAATTYV